MMMDFCVVTPCEREVSILREIGCVSVQYYIKFTNYTQYKSRISCTKRTGLIKTNISEAVLCMQHHIRLAAL